MKENAPSIGERRAGVAAIFLLLMAAVLFIGLGRWQLDRAQAQRTMEAAMKAATAQPELDLDRVSISEGDVFRHASADGIYDSGQQFYLEGRSHQEQMGYHVITALRVAGTRRYVLVNRGWMPGSERAAAVPAGRVHVRGILARAQMPGLLLGQPRGFTRPYLDPKAYAKESGRPVEPLMLLASADATTLVPVNPHQESKRAMHIGYALQWFAFAAIALGAAAVTGWRRLRNG